MQSLSDIDLADKVCLTRVDLNCPLDNDKNILDSTRIKAHAGTIKHIADHKGKVVVIAHQGRPGSVDFSTLELHAKKLQNILGNDYNVDFIPHTHGSKVEARIKKMNSGEILVLENVRMVTDEMKNKSAIDHANEPYIISLVRVGQIFINDAFSAAHRSHASLVGFTAVLPSAAGLIMEKEVMNLQRVINNPKKPCVFILGGIKPEDSFKVAEHVLNNNIADLILTGGAISQLLLIANGKSLGKPTMDFLEKKKLLRFLGAAENLISRFEPQVKVQTDFAVNEEGRKQYSLDDLPLMAPILDIGDQTITEYTNIIEGASTMVFNGPMGKFEQIGFEKGTLEVFKAMGRSEGFSLAGGGHSVSVIEKNNVELSYVSTAGGAMIQFLMGKPLPAISALNTAKKNFLG
ncbi:MAG: phosphoglycerate kinase [Candidatus Heimdallarchaeota archaeon]|nr:MAG: phosphoglycerate kinase [Candidatus Heimdallarchaeota archaeon]